MVAAGVERAGLATALVPALTVVLSLAFAAHVFGQYQRRRRPQELAWWLALVFYALAAGPEVLGSLDGWGAAGYRVYYLFGAVLLVPWLSLGTVELLAKNRAVIFGYRGLVAVVSLAGLVGVAFAGLHEVHLATSEVPSNCAMWCRTEAGYGAFNVISVIAAAAGNAIGTVVLVGGAGFSAYRTYRAGLPAALTRGNVLILVGALVVAGASTLTRFGIYALFYAGQAAGIAVIFAGFLAIGGVSASGRAAEAPGPPGTLPA